MAERGKRLAEIETLYEALATSSPPGLAAGETARSAGKETVDRDHECDLGVLLLDRS